MPERNAKEEITVAAPQLIAPAPDTGSQAVTVDSDSAPRSAGATSSAFAPGLRFSGRNAILPEVKGYEILDVLGLGGMGIVYKAKQQGLNRLVALKMILAGADAGGPLVERFRAEAQAVARLRHPHVVQVFEVGQVDGLPYFSMEYVEGGNLAAMLKDHPLPPDAAARILEQIARGIHAAHQTGIVHRDLKPSNILLQATGGTSGDTGDSSPVLIPKISDFGLAKQVESGMDLTLTGAVVGTPPYMAPEQASGKQVGSAADIYALGAILYECLTGRPPFKASTALETLRQVVSDEPVRPTALQPTVPRDLETICLKSLHKEPSRRYESAEALAEDLRRWQADEPIVARPIGRLARTWRWCRRNPALASAASLAGVALLAVALVSMFFSLHALASWENEIQAGIDLRRERDRANENRLEAQQSQRETERKLAENLLDRALAVCSQEGDPARGLLWLARALEAAPDHAPDLQQLIRANFTAWAGRVVPLVTVLPHQNPFRGFAWSADGKTILTANKNQAQLWDAGTGKPLGRPLVHDKRVLAVAISPGGNVLLTGCEDGKARLWQAETGLLIGAPLPHTFPVQAVAFSPDGKLIATASQTTVQLWDADTRAANGKPLPHAERVTGIVFSPDGERLLARMFAGQSHLGNEAIGQATVWDVVSRNAMPIRNGGQFAAFNGDGGQLIAGAIGGDLMLWDRSGTRARTLYPHGPVSAASFTRDGKLLGTGNLDRTARLWDVKTGKAKGPPLLHASQVLSAAFSPDGMTFLTGSYDGTARLWDVSSAQPLLAPQHHPREVGLAAFSADGKRTLSECLDGSIRVWDVSALGRDGLRVLNAAPIVISPDGRTILTGDGQLWDRDTRAVRGRLALARLAQAQFRPDGKTLVTADHAGAVQTWDAVTGKSLGQIAVAELPLDRFQVLSAGGTRLLKASKNSFQVLDVASGQGIGPVFDPTGTVTAAAFNPSGSRVATGALDGSVQVWDASTGKEVGPFGKHQRQVVTLAFSPDGKTLLSGSDDGMAQFWDADSGKARGAPLRHDGPVTAAAFSPDGAFLVTGSADRTARIWDTDSGKQKGPALAHSQSVRAVAVCPDGISLITASGNQAQRWHVATGMPIGPAGKHTWEVHPAQGLIRSLVVSPDGTMAATVAGDMVRFWPLPRPYTGTPAQVNLWVQVLTGMQLSANGVVLVLDGQTWQERRQRLP